VSAVSCVRDGAKLEVAVYPLVSSNEGQKGVEKVKRDASELDISVGPRLSIEQSPVRIAPPPIVNDALCERQMSGSHQCSVRGIVGALDHGPSFVKLTQRGIKKCRKINPLLIGTLIVQQISSLLMAIGANEDSKGGTHANWIRGRAEGC
jgi:hypothetical protein